MPKSDLTSVNPRKPTQFEPTPSDHAVKIIDWLILLVEGSLPALSWVKRLSNCQEHDY